MFVSKCVCVFNTFSLANPNKNKKKIVRIRTPNLVTLKCLEHSNYSSVLRKRHARNVHVS